MQGLVDAIIVLGHLPSQSRSSSTEEKRLVVRLTKARTARTLTWQHEAQLENLKPATREVGQTGPDWILQHCEQILQQLRDFGRWPTESAGRGLAERQLAERIRRARKAKQFSPEQEAEFQALQQAENDARAAASIAEAEEPPNPMEGFAEEAQSRIDQDLLMLESGIRTKALLRRLAVYKELVSTPSAQHEEFAQRYAERVRQASAAPAGKNRYVPGSEVDGDELRVFSERPVITGPLVCQLCESDFLTEEDFARHKQQDHAGEAE